MKLTRVSVDNSLLPRLTSCLVVFSGCWLVENSDFDTAQVQIPYALEAPLTNFVEQFVFFPISESSGITGIKWWSFFLLGASTQRWLLPCLFKVNKVWDKCRNDSTCNSFGNVEVPFTADTGKARGWFGATNGRCQQLTFGSWLKDVGRKFFPRKWVFFWVGERLEILLKMVTSWWFRG